MAKLNPAALATNLADKMEAANRKGQMVGFQKLLADPAVKYILSTMPEGPQDALMTLLRKAFYDGHTMGGTAAMGAFMEETIGFLKDDGHGN